METGSRWVVGSVCVWGGGVYVCVAGVLNTYEMPSEEAEHAC